jgi:hypothetical protein
MEVGLYSLSCARAHLASCSRDIPNSISFRIAFTYYVAVPLCNPCSIINAAYFIKKISRLKL